MFSMMFNAFKDSINGRSTHVPWFLRFPSSQGSGSHRAFGPDSPTVEKGALPGAISSEAKGPCVVSHDGCL